MSGTPTCRCCCCSCHLVWQSQIKAHEIHRDNGLDVRLSLALALSTIQICIWHTGSVKAMDEPHSVSPESKSPAKPSLLRMLVPELVRQRIFPRGHTGT
ncbi:hypothetical protein TNCV_2187511 [Trichonephila clavipes]|nr:hypothetical protein TNCV_2187511 [Trichonephila clavipes]